MRICRGNTKDISKIYDHRYMYYVVNPSVARLKSNKCIDMFFTALLPNVPTAKEVSNEGKKIKLTA